MFSLKHEIKFQEFNSKHKVLFPFLVIRQFVFLLSTISSCNIIISRFIGYHTFLPILFGKLFKKPIICILGGTECISFPSVKVGNFTKPFYRWVTKWCLNRATHLCPVHESLVFTNYTYQDNDFKNQGYLYFCPSVTTPYTVIYNGFDENKWFRNQEKKTDTFITVCANLDQKYIMELKGIDMIINVAPFFPEHEFIIIGATSEAAILVKSSNVKLVPPTANDQLIDYYSKATFYMQLSLTEGFPNALCEAMLCECIPIASAVGGMPDIIDGCGFLLYRKDLNLLKDIIKKALLSDRKNLSQKSRERIIKNYSLKLRENKFDTLFDLLA